MRQVTVREYALLTACANPKEQESNQLDSAEISESAYEYLCDLAAGFSKNGYNLLQIAGRKRLKLDNYVGVIETTCGTRLEILPKHIEDATDAEVPRKLLCKMLATALNLPNKKAGAADLKRYKRPLHEWIIGQFLEAFEKLISKGLRFEYQRIEDEQKYLRGQLDIARRMRQPVGREHIFPIRHDIFTPDRAENRLLRAALERICRVTQDPQNWRLAQELRLLTAEIPASRDIQQDLKKWQSGRLLAHYQEIKPWCELVLGQFMPVTVQGDWRGISLLFPMEKLFESYVAAQLKKQLIPNASLRTQVQNEHLCHHDSRDIFRLKPDLKIEHEDQNIILDTKWKRINIKAKRYDLKDDDLRQMFAYSHYYLQHKGDVVLIYPKWAGFQEALPVFHFRKTDKLSRLWVVPFDLDEDKLVLPKDCSDNKFQLSDLLSKSSES